MRLSGSSWSGDSRVGCRPPLAHPDRAFVPSGVLYIQRHFVPVLKQFRRRSALSVGPAVASGPRATGRALVSGRWARRRLPSDGARPAPCLPRPPDTHPPAARRRGAPGRPQEVAAIPPRDCRGPARPMARAGLLAWCQWGGVPNGGRRLPPRARAHFKLTSGAMGPAARSVLSGSGCSPSGRCPRLGISEHRPPIRILFSVVTRTESD